MNPFPLEDLEKILPVLTVFATATVVLVVDLFLRGWTEAPSGDTRNKWSLPTLSLLGGGLAAWFAYSGWLANNTGIAFQGALRVDVFSHTVTGIILLGTLLTLGTTVGYLRRFDIEDGEFYALVLYAAGSMMLLAQSNNLIMVFVSLETFSMAVYILSAFQRDSQRSVEGALKYFVLGGVSSAFLLFGLTFIYGASGSIQLGVIADGIANDTVDVWLLLAGLALSLVGFGFKVGAVPFHSWIPDAYEGAPSLVAGFMSVTVKTAAFAVLLRFSLVLAAPEAQQYIMDVLWWIAIATMIFGNLVALVQSSVKRMLAYSAISHTGYLLIGVVAALKSDDPGRGAPILFYLLPYTLMTFGGFALLAGLGRESQQDETFESFRGLSQRRPFLAFVTMIFMVSLAGIPPTAGFWGKFYLFREAVSVGDWPLAVVGVVTSLASVYYYLRLVVFMYMQPIGDKKPPEKAFQLSRGAAISVTLAAAGIVAVGLLPDGFLSLSEESLKSLVKTIGP